jgi:hypothetical protein
MYEFIKIEAGCMWKDLNIYLVSEGADDDNDKPLTNLKRTDSNGDTHLVQK